MGCDRCNSENVVKHGIRKNKYSIRQVFFCKNCSSFFSKGNVLCNSFYEDDILIEVLHLFCRGKSYGEIAETVNQEINQTVYQTSSRTSNHTAMNVDKRIDIEDKTFRISKSVRISKSTVHRWIQQIKHNTKNY